MNFIFSFILSKLKDYVLNNWKTTLLGIIAWVFAHWIGPKFGIGDAQQQEIMKLISDFIAPIALFAKDADKSGTVAQPRTDPAVVEKLNASLVTEKSVADLNLAP